MKTITTPIIPTESTFFKVDAPHELDLKAICCFVATGFFLDNDTYWQDAKVLRPASINKLSDSNYLISSEPWFQWHESPKDMSFDEALEEFSSLFESIVREQTENKSVILPLSGGLDSRTQAVALRNHGSVKTYSYDYKNGYPETKIGELIAASLNFPFKKLQVKTGYLWDSLDDLANMNLCYSEFTHPRQAAFLHEFKTMGEVFSLGHWGDVLFDSMHLPELTHEAQVDVLLYKLIKKGGLDLAESLWQQWHLEGGFKEYFRSRISDLLNTLKIENTNARLRAFKSKYWAPRWTSVNLRFFSSLKPVVLPYYENRICKYVCRVPEKYLANRQIQIGYVKRHSPELAKITWQMHSPFNLYTYTINRSPYNLPYRVIGKVKRVLKKAMGASYVSRNWELQFLGKANDLQLKSLIFDSGLENLIPKSLIVEYYNNFKEKDSVYYSHPISMIVTLALFNRLFYKEPNVNLTNKE